MLTVTRNEGEGIIIITNDSADSGQQCMSPIEIRVNKIRRGEKGQIIISISAPKEVQVLRGELVNSTDTI